MRKLKLDLKVDCFASGQNQDRPTPGELCKDILHLACRFWQASQGADALCGK